MNLVHVRIQVARVTNEYAWLQCALRSHATPQERVDHVSVHPDYGGAVTAGFWISGASVVDSERVAHAITRRAIAGEPRLRDARVLESLATLVPQVLNQLVHEAEDHGRNVRMTNPATTET